MNNNPFSISFGKEIGSSISRELQKNEIISDFLNEPAGYHVCIITGVRGAGKTVAL